MNESYHRKQLCSYYYYAYNKYYYYYFVTTNTTLKYYQSWLESANKLLYDVTCHKSWLKSTDYILLDVKHHQSCNSRKKAQCQMTEGHQPSEGARKEGYVIPWISSLPPVWPISTCGTCCKNHPTLDANYSINHSSKVLILDILDVDMCLSFQNL